MTPCGSCGRDEPDDALAPVQRIYVRAESWRDAGQAVDEGRIDVDSDVEMWCVACRSQYPHQPVET